MFGADAPFGGSLGRTNIFETCWAKNHQQQQQNHEHCRQNDNAGRGGEAEQQAAATFNCDNRKYERRKLQVMPPGNLPPLLSGSVGKNIFGVSSLFGWSRVPVVLFMVPAILQTSRVGKRP